MQAGILLIGSLLWDSCSGRENWRQSRLDINRGTPAKAPIYYGRRSQSRGQTFTMTFAANDNFGQGFLAPCKSSIFDVSALLIEAEALWKAEQRDAKPGSIAASWGCVGVLFRGQSATCDLSRAWIENFRKKKTPPVSPVDSDGLLAIPWPVLATGSSDIDHILATATKAEASRPSPDDVADAWVDQDQGCERYFFENIRHGIQTPEDPFIWRRIEVRKPCWLGKGEYAEAITILRARTQSDA